MLMFLWLLVGHAVCDYPLQGDFLAKAKNHRQQIPGFPFYHALGAHAMMHAGAVALITGSWLLGVLEFIAHVAIDYLKCDGRTTLNQDQALHVACKIVWVCFTLVVAK
jgi:hypothetical protein